MKWTLVFSGFEIGKRKFSSISFYCLIIVSEFDY